MLVPVLASVRVVLVLVLARPVPVPVRVVLVLALVLVVLELVLAEEKRVIRPQSDIPGVAEVDPAVEDLDWMAT
jgi:hypothetical protein